MSIFGSLTTGISGLQAQSAALGHISDNIANSQTTGYKRVDTAFTNLVLQSNSKVHNPGGVVARPSYANTVTGTISVADRNTNLAIRGQGFFSVSRLSAGEVVGQERLYTRDGSFELNEDRILANRSGFALNGYAYNEANNTFSTAATPIRVTADIDSPVATRNVTLAASLPTAPTPGQPIQSTEIKIYDAVGTPRTLTLGWRPGQTEGSWRMTIDAPGAVGSLPLTGTLPGFPVSAQSTSLTPGRVARAQIEDVQFSSTSGGQFKIGDVYTVNVNGMPFSTTITAQNAGQLSNLSGVAQSIADQINGAVPPTGAVATVINGRLQLKASSPGTGFTVNTSVTNATLTNNAVAAPVVSPATTSTVRREAVSFSGSAIDIGDVFQVTTDVGGVATPYTVTVSSANIGQLKDLAGVMTALAAQVNADSPTRNVVAAVSGNTLTLSGTQNGVDNFTSTASVTNSIAGNNTTYVDTVQGNITGSRQTQRISLSGVPGDVGAVYSVTVRSPDPIQVDPVITPADNVAVPPTPAEGLFDFTTLTPPLVPTDAPQLGQRVAITLNGNTYSVQITEQNQTNFATYDDVFAEIAQQVNNDFGAPYRADAYVAGSGQLNLVANKTTTVLDGTQTTLASFNRTISYTTTGKEVSLDEIAGNLALAVSQSGLPVQAAAVGGVLTLTSNQDGVAFLGSPMAQSGNTPPHIALDFGGQLSSGGLARAGTLSGMSAANVGEGNAIVSAVTEEGATAQVSFTVDYGNGPQQISLDLGNFGQATGLKEFNGSAINVTTNIADGSAQGTFQNVEVRSNGDVIAKYDNGNSRVIARVPVVLFNNANALERQTGAVFTESAESGRARFTETGLNGAGYLEASSLEGSNVDIAQEFTKLIVAQRSYTANTRVITTTDEMLTETINLKR